MQDQGKKVVVFGHSSGIGGATASLDTVAQDLKDEGYLITMFTPEGAMVERWKAKGYSIKIWKIPACAWLLGFVYSSSALRFHLMHWLLLAILPLRLFKAAVMVRAHFKRETVDFVLVNSLTLFPLGLCVKWMFAGQSPKLIWHLREVLNDDLPALPKRSIKWCVTRLTDRILAITSNETAGFEDFPDITVCHNTIPVKWRGMNVESSDRKDNEIRVMMVSMFLAGKGFEDYLDAALYLVKEFPDVKFDLYTPRAPYPFKAEFGSYPETESFLQCVLNTLNMIELTPNVRWWFDQEMSVELFQSHDIYVRPDRAGSPWGRDIIESMWLGLPIIATGSSEEFVKDGETGFLIPVGDKEVLREKVEVLLKDSKLRKSMAEKAKQIAHTLFDPALHRKKILNAFRE